MFEFQIRKIAFAIGSLLLMSFPAIAQDNAFFSPGNLVVFVEGCSVHGGTCTNVANGTGTGVGNSSAGGYGDNQAAPIALFQYTPNGTTSAMFLNSLVLPQSGSGANLPVSGEYGSSSEGLLQLSASGQYLTFMGYGINAAIFDAAYYPKPGFLGDQYGAAPSGALAQSGSLTGQTYTAVPRVVVLVDANGNVNSSTALFNIFNTNNPRSVYTTDGTSAYVSGQGSGCDATGGVFFTALGASNSAPTAITGVDSGSSSSCPTSLAQDTRAVQIFNNALYISVDSKEGSGSNRDFIGTLGQPPATSLYNNGGGPTQLSGFATSGAGKLTINGNGNNLNAGAKINLSPVNYFFASPAILYVADGGNPKNDSNGDTNSTGTANLGDGGLQKWVNSNSNGSGTWSLKYTLYQGLNLVNNGSASGTSGLFGLAGKVSGATVFLYATNNTLTDLDPTYLYGITDTLSFTTAAQSAGESFMMLDTAPADSNFKGVSFAPTISVGDVEITSLPSGLTFTSLGGGCAPGTYTAPQTLVWTPGSNCELTTASPQAGEVGVQYAFSRWEDLTTSLTHFVSAPQTTATYTAAFTTEYQLTTSAGTGGTVSPGGFFAAGTPAPVSASPSAGYHFVSFTGAVTSTSNPLSLLMDAPQSITANFSVPGPPNGVTATLGSGQSAMVGTTFGSGLTATVTDAVGNPVSGVLVTFMAPSPGATGTFANGTNTTQATTGDNGKATSTAFTANASVGGYGVVASAAETASSTTFELSNTSNGPAVTFIGTDAHTQGTWQTPSGMIYGTDGYVIEGASPAQSLPSYLTQYSTHGATPYTWAASATDLRALLNPNDIGRMAGTAFGTTFTYNANFTGSSHLFALYALDWDSTSRSETITFMDPNNGNKLLDTETISNFNGGEYLVWNVYGEVTIQVKLTGGTNAVISGLFFGVKQTVQVTPPITTLSANQQQPFAALSTGTARVSWSISNVTPVGAAGGQINPTTGLYTAPTSITQTTQLTVQAISEDATVSGSATVNLVPSGGGGAEPSVTFVKPDTSTQGNWRGTYGDDGYYVTHGGSLTPNPNIPGYAGFAVESGTPYTWDPNSSDVRALETGTGPSGSRVAAAWFNSASCVFDLTISGSHQFALYAMDWDRVGRSETVSIVDPNNSNHVLDTEHITNSNFENGQYLVWNISGQVKIIVTLDPGASGNAVVSGVFFGGVPSEGVTVKPQQVNLTANQQQAFTAAVTGTASQTVSWSILNGGVGSIDPASGLYTAPATFTPGTQVAIQAESADMMASGTATIILTPTAGVSFLGTDTATQGNWQGKYGTQGYYVINGAPFSKSLPSFATLTSTGASYTWVSPTSDIRALEDTASGPAGARIAATWFGAPSFTFDLDFTDGASHQFELYALDWDFGGRVQTITIMDPISGSKVLDTQTVSNFGQGTYFAWNISGHVKIVVTSNVGANAVIGGAFFN